MKAKGIIVNLEELSNVFGISTNGIRKWLAQKDFPVVQVADQSKGKQWQFNTAEVIKWRVSLEKTSDDEKGRNLKLRNDKLEQEVKRLEIENLKGEKEIVYIEDVRAFLRDLFTRIRQSLLNTAPNRIGTLTALESDVPKNITIARKELKHSLTQLSQPRIEDGRIQLGAEDD